MNKTELRFSGSEEYLICPVCRRPLFLRDKSLYCENGHCFDVSKKGYVSLLRGYVQPKGYDRQFFESRRYIFEKGFYAHILSAVTERVNGSVMLDAGCGEGYYSKALDNGGKRLFAFDISKDSVALASGGENAVCWFTADLSAIPIAGGCIDTVLNIFSPANYSEFSRVLQRDGLLIKAVPSSLHLVELRERLAGSLRNSEYTNDRIIAQCEKNFEICAVEDYSRTFKLSDDTKKALLEMTPMMFGVNERPENIHLTEITVSASVITAKPKTVERNRTV